MPKNRDFLKQTDGLWGAKSKKRRQWQFEQNRGCVQNWLCRVDSMGSRLKRSPRTLLITDFGL
ncbi:hypothetical protein [Coleofasciculus sp. FACHB-1120]|uniref:hypothetical protein n=1 Tax=Coleofasciculus sp. FACHB-1120 TaxID=2692783 RepID=UPI0016832811|nr:hypothetical protein [Coleofasciculus sp. FACHB-1120]MBD2741794.1 hypothetical protein [Coleofasciculus sp. FACHB-1120]